MCDSDNLHFLIRSTSIHSQSTYEAKLKFPEPAMQRAAGLSRGSWPSLYDDVCSPTYSAVWGLSRWQRTWSARPNSVILRRVGVSWVLCARPIKSAQNSSENQMAHEAENLRWDASLGSRAWGARISGCSGTWIGRLHRARILRCAGTGFARPESACKTSARCIRLKGQAEVRPWLAPWERTLG